MKSASAHAHTHTHVNCERWSAGNTENEKKVSFPGPTRRCRWLPRSYTTQLPRVLLYTLGKRSGELALAGVISDFPFIPLSPPPLALGEVRFDAHVVNKPDRPREHTSGTYVRGRRVTEGNWGMCAEGGERDDRYTQNRFAGFSLLGFSPLLPFRLLRATDLDCDPRAVTLVIR